MKNKKRIKFCPKCLSTDIDIALPPLKKNYKLFTPNIESGNRDECKNCHFRGNFPEMDKDKLEKLRKK